MFDKIKKYYKIYIDRVKINNNNKNHTVMEEVKQFLLKNGYKKTFVNRQADSVLLNAYDSIKRLTIIGSKELLPKNVA